MLENVTRVIFDLDNTLIKHDFEMENFKVIEKLGVKNKQKFKKEFSYMFQNNGKYLKKRIVTKKLVVEAIEMCMPILEKEHLCGEDLLDAIDYVCAGKLMEGADDLLEYLYNRGYQIVAFTNWFLRHQTKILKKLDALRYFERIYAWDDYYAKPHRCAMLRVLDQTDASQNVLIGDDPLGDITAAKKFGMYTIAFNIDYDKLKGNNKIQRADISVSSLTEIKQYL